MNHFREDSKNLLDYWLRRVIRLIKLVYGFGIRKDPF